ncbi:type II toxin-antitoxin system RelE/ParE family toxin [Streptococcus panodentis]|uniref:Type II toxin-antitoxin system mRNA interferase toxin, RelE/StbE family n=1 Tax=Streptococcus panodentis TaxID=1581472 RepID=A0ABS5B1Z7_9STRE|nr:type II toxin-antitoxin system RelE/ParE family toxin [Streptococcus panodentis]MBP2621994.1 type II toxin-antitoxin system mRNA interferase toxin, RelE/StbE family [Streptococcus panodentis]
MVYSIRYTARVVEELDRIYGYISTNFSIGGARRKISKIRAKINRLQHMPGGFDFDDRLGRKLNPNFKTQALVCDDYLILFLVDKKHQIVIVTHLIPSKSNYMKLLKK